MTFRLSLLLPLRPLSVTRLFPTAFFRTSGAARFSNIVTPASHFPRTGKHQLLMCRCQASVMLQQRFKKKKAVSKEQDERTDDEDNEEEEEDKDPEIDWLTVEKEIAGLQLDLMTRGFFHMTRERAMTMISDGLVRLNGVRALKTEIVRELDLIELIRGRNLENPDMLDISRAEITDIPDLCSLNGRYKIKARVWKFLTVENYKEEPYEGHVQSIGYEDKKFAED